MLSKLSAWSSLLALAWALPQGPNTLAANNPNVRTQAVNGTWFLVPVNTAMVQNAVSYPLLPVPVDDASLFPNGFPAGTHPVLVTSQYASDIRLIAAGLSLQINALLSGQVYVPYVDRLQDGKTPFNQQLASVIGGTDGVTLAGILEGVAPSLVGSLTGGNPVLPGSFLPTAAAWQSIGSNEFSASGREVIVPNPVTGPSVQNSIYDLDFFTTSTPLYTTHTFHETINQPIALMTGRCLRNTIYLNESFADQTLRTGTVRLYDNPLPTGFGGEYTGVGGFSAQGEAVGYNNQDCADAAATVDPAALAQS